jgi:Uncharacterized protein involved in exopolysaccharide biosynthesis
VISFDEEQFKEFKKIKESSNKFILNQSIELNDLPQYSFFTVKHSDPKIAQLLANQLPTLLNQYGTNSEQEFYNRENLKYQKQINSIQRLQSKILLEIELLAGKGTSSISLVEGGNDINIITQLKLRLGEKLADKALAIASNDQNRIQKINKEIFALDNEISEQDILMNLNQNISFKFKKKRKIYETLISQESKLIEITQQLEQKLSDLENRRIEILSSAALPGSPIKPKTRLIVALSAMVSLFVGIFLVFLIDYVKNLKSRLKENEERLSPA